VRKRSFNFKTQSDARSSDLLATTGDILRIWELVDDPGYGQSNSINSSSRANNNTDRHQQRLVKKAELVNVSAFVYVYVCEYTLIFS
jgi:hypothetical protein